MVTPLKSPLDNNGYRYIQLSNGLRALLVTSCDYGEPCRKKRAYTSKKCQVKNPEDDPEKCPGLKLTREFDRKHTVMAPNSPGLNVEASLLENIVYLSKTPLNVFHRLSSDVPSENLTWDDLCTDYPELTEKQKRAACSATRKYDMMACVSMCVGAGYFDDPRDLEGAAHLVEHTLFMGCETYPKKTHFDDFLDYTGGSSWNGNTDGHRTVYYFDTSTDYLAETFDIMVEHFTSPLFSVESISVERENMDAEFRRAVPIHLFRFNHFLQMLSTPGHPYMRFSWGNSQTLSEKKNDSQVSEMLQNFVQKFYSPSSMYLAVQAALSLNELEDLVKEAFENIPVRKVERLPMEKLPFSNERFTKLYRIVATTQMRLLAVTWQLPPESWKMYNVKPLEYIAHILLNENEDGLSYYLREKGLTTQVMLNPTETNMERSDACAVFSIHFYLTKLGLQKYQLVLEALYSFIQMMIRKGPQLYIFSELSKLKSMEFHYFTESDTGIRIKELSESMRIYRPEDVVCGPVLISHFDKELISQMTSLLKPDLANYMLIAKEFHSLGRLVTEKYFNIQYKESHFPPEDMKRLKFVKPFKEFCLCKPNPFIATNFCLVEPDSPEDVDTVVPIQILDPDYPPDKQRVNVWLFQDDNFVIPQATYAMTISSPISNESAHNAVMLDIFVTLFRNLFRGHIFSATTALIDYSMNSTSKGIHFRYSGFNDKLPLLFAKTLDQFSMVEQQASQKRFNESHFQVKEDYENRILQCCVLSS